MAVSFIDQDCQWLKTIELDQQTMNLDVSFCTRAIESDELTVVPDATEDPRFAASPLVTGPPHLRFYAAAPLITPDGYRLGTLCILGHGPARAGRVR